MVLVATLVILAPFVTRARTMDDPLFIWTAQHLQQHPTDPFGFSVNWFGVPQSMLLNVQNPPLASYWLALAGLVSWADTWLHASMLPFALLAVWGVSRLAGLVRADPFWAPLLTLSSAAFLISATNVMCDVMLVAMMVWAIVLWVEGLNRNSVWILLAGAIVAALAAWSKYFGISLIPLLAVYTIIRQRRVTWTLAPLMVTVAPLVIGLWRGRLAEWIVYAAAAGIGGYTFDYLNLKSGIRLASVPVSSVALASVFFAAGISLFLLTLSYQWKNRRRPEAWLLGLWIWGTIIFMAFINWTVAARNLLPMVPALAVVVTMRPGQNESSGRYGNSVTPQEKPLPLAPMAIASGVGLLVAITAAWADADWAGGVRETAGELAAKYQAEGKQVAFQGHRGFQYYMERAGAEAQNLHNLAIVPNLVAILPANNTNVDPSVLRGWETVEVRREAAGGGLYVNDVRGSAGFYCHLFGLLPFAMPTGTPDKYSILQPPREWFQSQEPATDNNPQSGGRRETSSIEQSHLANQLVALSFEHYNRSNWQKSMEVCNQQLAPDPRNTAAYNNLGCSHIKLKDYDRTEEGGNPEDTNQVLLIRLILRCRGGLLFGRNHAAADK